MTHKIVATNSKGQQLTSGYFWRITTPIPRTPQVPYDRNVVYHVGKEKYIQRIWDKNFKNSGLTTQGVSGTIET